MRKLGPPRRIRSTTGCTRPMPSCESRLGACASISGVVSGRIAREPDRRGCAVRVEGVNRVISLNCGEAIVESASVDAAPAVLSSFVERRHRERA
jgi:hypothetical protein